MTAHTNRQTHVQSGRQVRNKQGKHAGGQRQTGLVFITTTAGFWGKWVFLCACTNRRSLPTVTGGLLQWNVVQKNLVFWISVLQIEKVMQIWCMGKSTGPYHLITSLKQCHWSCFFLELASLIGFKFQWRETVMLQLTKTLEIIPRFQLLWNSLGKAFSCMTVLPCTKHFIYALEPASQVLPLYRIMLIGQLRALT